MRNTISIICCALGSGMIGFFANQLNTIAGSLLFAVGVALLVCSIVVLTKRSK